MRCMEGPADIENLDLAALRILHYPDPRLTEVSKPVRRFDEPLRGLAEKMFELMFAARGVGLAASQVGVPIRMFVASPAFQEQDRRVYVNPRVLSAEDWQEEEEGCLSFPSITCKIKRHKVVVLEAGNLAGAVFQETGEGLTARIFEHEMDHLEGRLLVNRMGSVARLTRRKALKELEAEFAEGR